MSTNDDAFEAWWAAYSPHAFADLERSQRFNMARAGWNASHEHDAAEARVVRTCSNCLPLRPLRELLEAYREFVVAVDGIRHVDAGVSCQANRRGHVDQWTASRARIEKLEKHDEQDE